MTNQEIKSEKERCFEQIKVSNERLEEIRKICNHEDTIECAYSWRIGNIQLAIICKYCGEFIRFVDEEMNSTVTYTYIENNETIIK